MSPTSERMPPVLSLSALPQAFVSNYTSEAPVWNYTPQALVWNYTSEVPFWNHTPEALVWNYTPEDTPEALV